jgi:uncharacterized protein (UPF0333 family)
MASKKNNKTFLLVAAGIAAYFLFFKKNTATASASASSAAPGSPATNFSLKLLPSGQYIDGEGYIYTSNGNGTFTDEQGNIVDNQGNYIQTKVSQGSPIMLTPPVESNLTPAPVLPFGGSPIIYSTGPAIDTGAASKTRQLLLPSGEVNILPSLTGVMPKVL